MIERFNRILEEVLTKLEETYDWDKFVKFILISYNTNQQASTRITLYYLIFERNLKLPIKEITLSRNTILNRVIELIYKVPIFRESVKVAINRTQQKINANYQM